ncbi:MAG: zinc dependent phospholipase C family protein [Phycisphaerae bacterium]
MPRIRLGVMIAAFCLLGVTQQAMAWGPATHIGLAARVLDHLFLLPTAVAVVLARHSWAYLYGNIAADIVFAKRLSRVKQFCHHWSTAFRLFDGARDDEARAFTYGYLSHLAADTIAHGKFIPRQLVTSGASLRFGHLYWELRADACEPIASWKTLESVLDRDHSRHHDRIEHHFSGTFLPYDLNRFLFHRVNRMVVRRDLRRKMNTWGRRSRGELPEDLLHEYRAECFDRIVSVLTDGTRSPLVREDPNGTSALTQVKVRRREARRLKRRGVPVTRRLQEASLGLAPKPFSTSELYPFVMDPAHTADADDDAVALRL